MQTERSTGCRTASSATCSPTAPDETYFNEDIRRMGLANLVTEYRQRAMLAALRFCSCRWGAARLALLEHESSGGTSW